MTLFDINNKCTWYGNEERNKALDKERLRYAQPRFEFPCMKTQKITRLLPVESANAMGGIKQLRPVEAKNAMGGFNCPDHDKNDNLCKECGRVFLKISKTRCTREKCFLKTQEKK